MAEMISTPGVAVIVAGGLTVASLLCCGVCGWCRRRRHRLRLTAAAARVPVCPPPPGGTIELGLCPSPDLEAGLRDMATGRSRALERGAEPARRSRSAPPELGRPENAPPPPSPARGFLAASPTGSGSGSAYVDLFIGADGERWSHHATAQITGAGEV